MTLVVPIPRLSVRSSGSALRWPETGHRGTGLPLCRYSWMRLCGLALCDASVLEQLWILVAAKWHKCRINWCDYNQFFMGSLYNCYALISYSFIHMTECIMNSLQTLLPKKTSQEYYNLQLKMNVLECSTEKIWDNKNRKGTFGSYISLQIAH